VKVLVIDVGGSHVKLLATGHGHSSVRRFDSGKHFTPDDLVKHVRRSARGWHYDVIALGYPGKVGPKGPVEEPGNLGPGWVGFHFEATFGKPVRIVNDAVMQALGGYEGGRMLFLGLGTGLGSALVSERVIIPLELGSLPYTSRDSIADRLGKRGRRKHGKVAWGRALAHVVEMMTNAFSADYILLGGGNAEEVDPLPPGTRRGGNEDAITGGFRLWEDYVEPHDAQPPPAWRVVQ
jgi:polyphosphate glucokinase